MKKFRHYALLLFAVMAVSGCSKDDDAPVVTLDQTTLNVYVGEEKTLTATITPPDDSQVITWASSDETIATVEDGTVTGKSTGTAIITAATQDGGKATCTVTVIQKGYPWYLDGKESGKFEIATLEELKQFVLLLNGDKTALDFNDELFAVSFRSQTITLKNDINLNNEEWTPIGTESGPFQGIFDGNGKTISGLKVSGTLKYAGFFGCTKTATVKNLKISGGTVSATNAAGGIVGYTNQNSIIENCSSSVTVSGALAGGIVGWAFKSVIKACHATGKITATKNNSPNGSVAAGGVVGYLVGSGSIQACYYTTGTVTGGELLEGSYFRNGTGGIAGQVGSSDEKVTNCYSTGKVVIGVGNKIYAGGAIGFANYSSGNYSSLLYITDTNTSHGIGEKPIDDTSIVKSIASESELSANIDFLNTGLPGEVGYRFKADGTLEKVQ